MPVDPPDASAAAVLAAVPPKVAERATRVRLMIFDVDGVLTDGRLYFNAGGDAMKAFDAQDGHGVHLLGRAGIATAILTGRQSAIVAERARELRFTHVRQGSSDKVASLAELCETAGIAPGECGYMGDDWPDLGVLARVGFAAAPSSAHRAVRAAVHWVSQARAGRGAVREACDLLLAAQGHYDALLTAARDHASVTGQ